MFVYRIASKLHEPLILAILTAVERGLQNSSKRILFDHLFRSILELE